MRLFHALDSIAANRQEWTISLRLIDYELAIIAVFLITVTAGADHLVTYCPENCENIIFTSNMVTFLIFILNQ